MFEPYYMNEAKRMKCHGIIHAASLATAGIGAGLAQLPGSDNLAIAPIQLTMIITLGTVFRIDLDKSTARATLATAAATLTGRTVSQVLIGWMPGIGNALNAVTAASITETIGWAVASDFHKRHRLEIIKNKKLSIVAANSELDDLIDENFNDAMDERIEEKLEFLAEYLLSDANKPEDVSNEALDENVLVEGEENNEESTS